MDEMGGSVFSSSVPGMPPPEAETAGVSVGTKGPCAKCHYFSPFSFAAGCDTVNILGVLLPSAENSFSR